MCSKHVKFKAATMTEANEWVKTLWSLQHRHNPGQEVDYGLSQVPSTKTKCCSCQQVCQQLLLYSLCSPLSPFQAFLIVWNAFPSYFNLCCHPLCFAEAFTFFILALLLFFHHTHPAHSSTPIFIKAATALSASQNTQDRKTAFQGNSESQNHLGWKRFLEII